MTDRISRIWFFQQVLHNFISLVKFKIAFIKSFWIRSLVIWELISRRNSRNKFLQLVIAFDALWLTGQKNMTHGTNSRNNSRVFELKNSRTWTVKCSSVIYKYCQCQISKFLQGPIWVLLILMIQCCFAIQFYS